MELKLIQAQTGDICYIFEKKQLVLHVYYWDAIQETIDITMTSSRNI